MNMVKPYFIHVKGDDYIVKDSYSGATDSTHGSMDSAKSRCVFLGVDEPRVVYAQGKRND